MSDLFQDGVADDVIDQVFDVIKHTPQHRYQILTKGAEKLRVYFKDRLMAKALVFSLSSGVRGVLMRLRGKKEQTTENFTIRFGIL